MSNQNIIKLDQQRKDARDIATWDINRNGHVFLQFNASH